MQIFLSAFDDVPDPRASNARHDLGELLVIAFVSVLCGSASCAEMAAFGRAKERLFRDFLKLKYAIPSHDTFSETFRVIDPKALDAAFGKVLADVAALLKDGDVIAIDGKALRGAREKNESARTRMMVSAYASRLRLTLATVTADRGTELDAATVRRLQCRASPVTILPLSAISPKASMAASSSVPRSTTTGPSKTLCIGSLTSRSAKTPHATERTTDQATSPCCAAALWMSSGATHPKALSASNSSARAGMRHSYAVFSMGWQKHEAKRDCPDPALCKLDAGKLTPDLQAIGLGPVSIPLGVFQIRPVGWLI
ncbi:MAG: hypothetical protein ACJAQU_001645 [Loktanella salsilacus]|jgi:hypothetical protein